MIEEIPINIRTIERKAFDIRNEDIYQYFLSYYKMFDHEKPTTYFPFLYDTKSKDLKEFCLKYKLYSIAGSGSELDKSIRLMNWVYHVLPSGKNAIRLTGCTPDAILSQTKKIVNCYNHAIVLNATLLAIGIYSRCIWCKPFDVANLEYHVVNVAYIKQYGKWIMLDSANQVICYDDRNMPMDIMDIRHALVENLPIRIGNDGGEWRGKYAAICRKKYFAYMKKNCFRFSCYLKSCYLQEKENELVELVPQGYYPSTGTRKKERNSQMLLCHYTTNTKAFWTPPEKMLDTRERDAKSQGAMYGENVKTI